MMDDIKEAKAIIKHSLDVVIDLTGALAQLPASCRDCSDVATHIDALHLPERQKKVLQRVLSLRSERLNESREDNEARILLGAALADSFFSGRDPLPIFNAVAQWDAWLGYEARLRELVENNEANAEKLIKLFETVINEREEHPGKYSRFKSEAEEYEQQVLEWRTERNLAEIFHGRGFVCNGFLPGAFTLGVLLPDYPVLAARLLQKITAIDVLNDAIWIMEPGAAGPALLSAAALTDCEGEWNGNALAPFLLLWGVGYAQRELEKSQGPDQELDERAIESMKKFWMQMADALMERKDGVMLALAFLPYLLSRSRGVPRVPLPQKGAISIAANAIAAHLKYLWSLPLPRLFEELCGIEYSVAENTAKHFEETGILGTAIPKVNIYSLLSLTLTEPQLKAKQAQKCLAIFRKIMCFAGAGLDTNEYTNFSDIRHLRMGKIISACQEPFAVWNTVQKELSSANYRLSYAPFGPQSSDLRSVRNFFLISTIWANSLLKENGKELATALAEEIADLKQTNDFDRRFLERAERFYHDHS